MKKIKQLTLLVALALTSGVASLASLSHFSSYESATALNPADGASYYATNANDMYYSGIDESLEGENLMVALSTLTTTGFVSYAYSSLPSIYQYSDLSLTDSSKMVMVYTGTEVSFSSGGMPGSTNKEHVWPASWYGNGTRTESAGSPGADAHNVWPSAIDLNSKRGSCAFDELDFSTSYKAYEFGRTDWSYGTDGDNDSFVWSTAFNYSNGQNTDAMYPAEGHRGAIARILMYVATRYRNNTTYPVMLHDQAVTLNTGRIGKLSTLLKWHFMEPPTEWEIKRNNEVASRWHHNRNPFVDHPEYASKIFYTLPEPGSGTPTAAVKTAIETYGDLNQGIVLEHSALTLNEGQSTKINVTNNPNSESITWSSDNTSVADVDSQGNVSAKTVGTATITAQGTETSATCVVTVIDPNAIVPITSLTVSPTTKSLQVGEEINIVPTIVPTNATNKVLNWTSSNTGVGVVSSNGHVIGVGEGTTTITASATDSSGLSATCSVTVTPLTSGVGGWNIVTDASSLAVGDKLVMASAEKDFTAGDVSGTYMTNFASVFSEDKASITTLHASTVELTLGGSSGAWTLSNNSNQLLGATAEKSVAWGSGTTTWTISISGSNATIQNTTSSYGRFLYNVRDPRFTTYTSATSSSMLLPQLYRFTDEGADEIKQEAYDFVSTFMNTTASECATLDVKSTTWDSLKSSYQSISQDAKNYIYENSESDVLISSMVERYVVIITNYGYENFLVDDLGVPFLSPLIDDRRIDVFTLASIIVILTTAIGVSGLGIIYHRRRRSLGH
ncbi:MAG: endonuclease [Sphaerochaetaceae bacterium]|nr:endonuclease [Sphaerochaetaceae bacterium]